MKDFRTPITLSPLSTQFGYDHDFFFIGSCFTEHMCERFKTHQLKSRCNPNGIVFHPQVIARQLQRILQLNLYTKDDLIETSEGWTTLDHHGKFKFSSSDEALEVLNDSLKRYRQILIAADVAFFTFGSAFGWHHTERNILAANCHRLPQMQFEKRLSTHDQINSDLSSVIEIWKNENSQTQFVFTVSPVKYHRDGIVENVLSKSHLIIAAQTLAQKYGHYFPAYEFVTEDLRDYRFYKDDMLHPSELAVSYIWDHLKSWLLNTNAHAIMQQLGPWIKKLQHQGLDAKSRSEAENAIQSILTSNKAVH